MRSDLCVSALLSNQGPLVGNPVLLSLSDLFIQLLDVLRDRSLFIFQRPVVLLAIAVASMLGQLGKQSVQAVDPELLSSDLSVAFFNCALLVLNLLLLLLELPNQLAQLLLQQLVLTGSVQVVNLDSRDFIADVLNLNLLFTDSLVGLLGLLEQSRRRLLDGLLLTGVVDDVVPDVLGLRVQIHDRLLDHSHLLVDVGLLGVHPRGLSFGLLK